MGLRQMVILVRLFPVLPITILFTEVKRDKVVEIQFLD